MAQCVQCHRSYKTKNSLARHMRNHVRDESRQLHCTICDVVFARRDILNRHMRQSHSGGSESRLERSRVHTACEFCRQTRTRCNGRNPCLNCTRHKRACSYANPSRRISRAIRTTAPSEHGSVDLPSPLLTIDDNGDSPGLHQAANAEQAAIPHSWLDGEASTAHLAWPWLHENYFLYEGDNDWSISGLEPIVPGERSYAPQFPPADTPEPVSAQHPRVESEQQPMPADGFVMIERDGLHSVQSIAENLVRIATGAAFSHDRDDFSKTEWYSLTKQLAETIGINTSGDQGDLTEPAWILHYFADEFLEHFNPLWPMFSKWQWAKQTLHPILLLTMSSIGAMYGSRAERLFGTCMHERLRRLLSAALFDLEGPDDDLLWLAHARVLTQVHALYFGQRQGFSYAQHLGSILVAQARRMNLFQETTVSRTRPSEGSARMANECCKAWVSSEGRRRLAFGIMRADVYTSVLFDNRPSLSPLEIKLTNPRSDETWHNCLSLPDEELAIAQDIQDAQSSNLFLCDIVTIALEKSDHLPRLNAAAYEMLMFGLQDSVWRFAHDPDLFLRLTGETHAKQLSGEAVADRNADLGGRLEGTQRSEIGDTPQPAEISFDVSLLQKRHDRIGQIPCGVDDLKHDYSRLCGSLANWMARFDVARVSPQFVQRRDTLMSGLLLHDLSLLRLSAPLQDLHQVAYNVPSDSAIDESILHRIRRWKSTSLATEASRHAKSIVCLIEQELQRPAEAQARFNLLAFCSLHHAAVVLWTTEYPGGGSTTTGEPSEILLKCASLFDRLSSLGGSSFKQAALRLSTHVFPDT